MIRSSSEGVEEAMPGVRASRPDTNTEPGVHLSPMTGICAADNNMSRPGKANYPKGCLSAAPIPFFTETLQHTEKPSLLSEGRIRVLQKHETHICDSWLTSKNISLFKTYKICNFLQLPNPKPAYSGLITYNS